MPSKSPKESWSSKKSFILAATGAAVGLGNIWKFPYMAGDNGGSAFVIIYLICVVFIGLPIMMAEIILGKCGCKNPIDTMKNLAIEAKATPMWRYTGWIGSLSLLLILSFYSVVSGWSIFYLLKTSVGFFNNKTPYEITEYWNTFLQSPLNLLIWHSLFMFITMYVVAKGVKNGLEKASNILMPALFVVLILLAIYSSATGDSKKALNFLFSFDYHKITPSLIIDALGHAFFTLALGAGCMLVYGAYLPKKVTVSGSVVSIAFLDVMVAFLSGMAIFPLVFKYNLTPQGGPGLMFEVLPITFAQMPFGSIIGTFFFLLLLFAAWTSSISLAEPLVLLLIEKAKISRKISAIIVGCTAWVIGIGSLLSFNLWSDYKLFGKWTIFYINTDLTTNFLLPIGGLLFSVFAGWKLSQIKAREALGFQKEWQYKSWLFLVKYIAPIAIILIIAKAVI
tara:strand:- start:2729 stop:4081 length:1353 start_codon:yes stop_codon:yes gene_type:complete